MKILFVLLIALGCYANPTGSELKKPNSTAFDFTFQSPQNKIQETLSDMILIEISKQTLLERRQENLWQCQTDQFGTTYCPTGLESAKSYTAYSPSTSLEREDTVIDYEQGTYAEKTSVVRDFMDGFATSHNANVIDKQTGNGVKNIATVIDYQNGSSIKRSNTVVDYAKKQGGGVETASPTTKKSCRMGVISGINGVMSGFRTEYLPAEGVADLTFCRNNSVTLEDWRKTRPTNATRGYSVPVFCGDLNNVCGIVGIAIFENYTCPSGYTLKGSVCERGSAPECPEGYSATTGAETSKGECRKNVAFNFYEYTCPATYTPVNNGFTSYTKTDPNTSAVNWNTLDDDVNSATPPVGNCEKTITYPYYNYNCPSGYTVNDKGLLDACPRTDPDKAINNESTLSQPCNSATPAAGNCEKVIPYTFYSYECSAGYTAIDKGLATCTKTDTNNSNDTSSSLSQPCNSATPPKENCYKDISYKHYTYGCSPGYITDNYGLATCPKTDPNRNVNNSATLDDDCNSKTPPEGNCRRSYSYKYYEYLCQGKNSFLESYKTLNKGLASCTKTDTNKNAVNSELANACNSSTPPANNCQSTEYACDSTLFKPVYVGGKWVCSPYLCNDDMKCGYGTCDLPTTPSTTKYQDIAYNPLGTVNNNKCNGDICDFVVNARVTYCETKQCQKGDDIIEKNGKCYKLECPAGTYLSGEKCIKVN